MAFLFTFFIFIQVWIVLVWFPSNSIFLFLYPLYFVHIFTLQISSCFRFLSSIGFSFALHYFVFLFLCICFPYFTDFYSRLLSSLLSFYSLLSFLVFFFPFDIFLFLFSSSYFLYSLHFISLISFFKSLFFSSFASKYNLLHPLYFIVSIVQYFTFPVLPLIVLRLWPNPGIPMLFRPKKLSIFEPGHQYINRGSVFEYRVM